MVNIYSLRKLSEKKILVKYIVPVVCNDVKIEDLEISIKYRLSKDDGLYHINIGEKFMNILSNRWGIKKKFISLPKQEISAEEIEGYPVKNYIDRIQLNSIQWFREFQLKKIIK